MKELRCPSCKKLICKADVVGIIEVTCRNNKCAYHKKPIVYEVYPHVFDLMREDTRFSRLIN